MDVPTDPMGTVEVQENSVISVPEHVRPLIQMGPVPSPKAADVKDVVTVCQVNSVVISFKNYCFQCHVPDFQFCKHTHNIWNRPGDVAILKMTYDDVTIMATATH